jgi:hypothetical protein
MTTIMMMMMVMIMSEPSNECFRSIIAYEIWTITCYITCYKCDPQSALENLYYKTYCDKFITTCSRTVHNNRPDTLDKTIKHT